MPFRLAAVAVALAWIAACSQAQEHKQNVERIFLNGKVWTGGEKKPLAAALAIRGDKIVAVGTAPGSQEGGGRAEHAPEAQARTAQG